VCAVIALIFEIADRNLFDHSRLQTGKMLKGSLIRGFTSLLPHSLLIRTAEMDHSFSRHETSFLLQWNLSIFPPTSAVSILPFSLTSYEPPRRLMISSQGITIKAPQRHPTVL
jgi:hypothetical protein